MGVGRKLGVYEIFLWSGQRATKIDRNGGLWKRKLMKVQVGLPKNKGSKNLESGLQKTLQLMERAVRKYLP